MKNPFRTPTAPELAERQLAEAERQLLQAQAVLESCEAHVGMLQKRVDRLRHRTSPAIEMSGIPRQLVKVA